MKEINNLNLLVHDFQFNYSTAVEKVYFQELEHYLENCLVMSLNSRLGLQISSQVVKSKEEILQQISAKFPDYELQKDYCFNVNVPQIQFFVKTNSHQDFLFNGEFSFSYGLFYWFKAGRNNVELVWITSIIL